MLLKHNLFKTITLLLLVMCYGLTLVQAQTSFSALAAYTQMPCDHDGEVTVTVTGGTAPFSYTWYGLGGLATVVTTTNVLNNLSGEYIYVAVSDATGQVAYDYLGSAFPFEITYTANPANCPLNDGSIVASVTSGGTAPFVYSWYDGGNFIGSNSTGTLNNLAPGGQYEVRVYDAAGCSLFSTDIDSLPYIEIPSVNNILANQVITPANCVNGSIVVNPTGGTAPYSYTWHEYQNGILSPLGTISNVANNLVAYHQYQVKITDANACFKINNFYMPTNINIWGQSQFTPENCDDNDGTAAALPQGNATPPYTYSWNTVPPQITQTASNLSEGNYICYIVSANGCETQAYVNVPVVSPVNLTFSVTGSNDCNNPNGTATMTATGGTAPYTYSWSNGQTTQTATGLAVGNYNCLVTDATGCAQSGTIAVPLLNPMVLSSASVPTSSCLNPNGQSTINVTGGTSPYTYSWANGQTSQTATGLNVGNHQYWVTDATGCIKDFSAYITYGNNLGAYLSVTPEVCAGTQGTATANIVGGAAPFTYSWNNGQTTPTITGLSAGSYTCEVTDGNGCNAISWGTVNYVSPVGVVPSAGNASCIYVPDGNIMLNAAGGTPPYTYYLNGNVQSTPNFTGLLPYNYYAGYVVDANGCTTYTNTISVGYNAGASSCIGTISGVVYDDLNQNCVQDAGEMGIPQTMVHCSNFGYVYTNNAGYYSFQVPVGNYNVEHYPTLYHKAKCPASGLQVVNVPSIGANVIANFADSTTLVSDLQTSHYANSLPVPGFSTSHYTVYENVGTVAVANAEPRHLYDSQLSIVSVTPSPSGTIYTPEELTFGTMNLQPYTYFDVNSIYNVPTNVPLGVVLTYTDTVFPMVGDVTPYNNGSFYQTTVVGAYDPNYKEVFPKGDGPEGYITVDDSVLEYVLHFQNTGTYVATNVILIDSIDDDFDLTSIDMGYSSHNYIAKVSENGILEITFPNIMLPDSGTDMIGSNGFVAFKIKQKKNLQMGTQFTNQVGIIFDFNYPIYTNTTLNTLHEPTSVAEIKTEKLGLYPNPAQNVLNIEIPFALQGEDLTFECLDLTGKVMMRKEHFSAGKNQVSVSELPQGWYFARVSGKDSLLNGKFVIVR